MSLGANGHYNRRTPSLVYTLIERRLNKLLGSDGGPNWAEKVNYGDGANVSLGSTDKNYLLYTLSCFLEDYLSKATLSRAERQYISVIKR